MRIDSIYLRDVGPFDEVTIPFPKGKDDSLADVYLLTGPNGCGKTTVLYAIAAHFGKDDKLLQARMRSHESQSILDADGRRNEVGPVGRSQIPWPRDKVRRLQWAAFAYAGRRGVGSGRVDAVAPPKSDPEVGTLSFHDTANTSDLAQWISNQDFRRLKAKEAGRQEDADLLAKSVRDIEEAIGAIVDDPSFKFTSGRNDLDVQVTRHDVAVNLEVLPDGLKSIVSWLADLLMRLDRMHWDDTPVMRRSFLLLLDEIDIHLHPEWQRKVIPVVQRLFPNAQIIASTHSPFVVASAEDAHVVQFVMEHGKSRVADIFESQGGVSYSALLKGLFGVNSEFDVHTEEMFAVFHAAKVRLLRGETVDRAEVDQIAHQLARRSEEIADIMGLEMRQLERQLAKRAAG